MEASIGRRTGVPALHRRPGDDVSTSDVIGGDSQRRHRDSRQLSDVTRSSAATETSAFQYCVMTHKFNSADSFLYDN